MTNYRLEGAIYANRPLRSDDPKPTTADWQPNTNDYLVREALAEPMVWEWEGKAVHEWRLYVTEEVRSIWHTFTPRQKVAIMRMADKVAGNENWD